MDGEEKPRYKRPRECPICDGLGEIEVYTSLAPGEREEDLSPGERLYCALVANHLETSVEDSIRMFFDFCELEVFPQKRWDEFDAQMRDILIERKLIPKGVRVEGVEPDA